MKRPSEPMLRWLRAHIDKRGENTASLALKLNRPARDLRRILTGQEPMLVDDLIAISQALSISAEDLGVPIGPDAEAELADDAPEATQWSNQPRALVQLGFDLGIDFMIFAAADDLAGWGGPENVRKQHAGKEIPLQCLAQFHRPMRPRVEDSGLTMKLGFDALYECWIPWGAIRRVLFTPFAPVEAEEDEAPAEIKPIRPTLRAVEPTPPPEAAPEKDEGDDEAPPPPRPTGGKPFLRLVK